MLRLILYENESQAYSGDFEGTVILGRADAERKEPAPFARLKLENGSWKVVFAPAEEKVWSRRQVIIEPVAGGTKVKVTNGGAERRFVFEGGRIVAPGDSCEVPLPAVVNLGGSKAVRVQGVGAPKFLPNMTVPPGALERSGILPSLVRAPIGIDKTEAKEVIGWLNAAMDVLQAAASSDEFFDRAAAAAVQMVDLDSARLLLHRGDGDWHLQAVKQASGREVEVWNPSQRVLGQMLMEKRTVWDVLDEGLDGKSLYGVDAVIAAPVLDPVGHVIGALYGERRRAVSASAPPITEAEAMLVELLARGVAAGLARQKQERAALALQSELEIGRQIQKSFLPVSLPQFANWEIGARIQPAKEVSGDFYDVYTLSENFVGLVIADVCNKGLGAALFMALFRSLLRAFSQQGISRDVSGAMANCLNVTSDEGERTLSSLLIELNALTTVALTNNYVANMHADACYFATVFLGVLDTTTGVVHYVNAGHDPPIHLGPGGVKGRLQPTGAAIGFAPDQSYHLRTITLEPGDVLFCYTDGLTDAHSPAGELFRERRVLELVNRPFDSATQILNLVEETVKVHTGGGPPFDDLTLLAIHRSPPASPT